MNSLKRRVKILMGGTGGTTLVEAMLAVVLLSVAALILAMGFTASSNLIRRGRQLGDAGQSAASVAEGAAPEAGVLLESARPGTVTMTINGTPVVVAGTYDSAAQTGEPGAVMDIFLPDSYTP